MAQTKKGYVRVTMTVPVSSLIKGRQLSEILGITVNQLAAQTYVEVVESLDSLVNKIKSDPDMETAARRTIKMGMEKMITGMEEMEEAISKKKSRKGSATAV